METAIGIVSELKYEYFKQDDMARTSVGLNKQWEPHITNFVKLYNSFFSIKNIIDVGANFGYHTLLFSKEVEQSVFAFEPQLQNYSLLEKNIEHNSIKNIKPFNTACGNSNCEIRMPITTDTKNYHNMGDFTPNIMKNNSTSHSITQSVRLDDMDFPQIDLIKIDVQGWEKKVLSGCSNLLKKYKPTLIVEFEHFQLSKTVTTCEELFKYIRENNYHIFYLDYQYPADHVCVHNDNLEEFRSKFKTYIVDHTIDNNLNHNIHHGVNEKLVVL